MTPESVLQGYFVGYGLTLILFMWIGVQAAKSDKPEWKSKMKALEDAGPLLVTVVLLGFCVIWPYHLYLMLKPKKSVE